VQRCTTSPPVKSSAGPASGTNVATVAGSTNSSQGPPAESAAVVPAGLTGSADSAGAAGEDCSGAAVVAAADVSDGTAASELDAAAGDDELTVGAEAELAAEPADDAAVGAALDDVVSEVPPPLQAPSRTTAPITVP